MEKRTTKQIAQIVTAVILALLAIFSAIVYYYYGVEDLKISALKDIIFFGISIAVSYLVARMISREDYNSELQKLGDLSSRRIYRLTVNLRQIAKSISSSPLTTGIANELKRLAEDADQSALDISLITGHKVNSQLDTIYCPKCGAKDKVELSLSRGSTEVIVCNDCKSRFNIHRTENGIKINLQVSSYIPTPVDGIRISHVDSSDESSKIPEYIETICPNNSCGNHMRIIDRKTRDEFRVYCTECYTSTTYNFGAQEIRGS